MDLSDNDLVNTKLDNGTMSIYGLIDYWYMKFGIEEYQRDYAKEYIKNLEEK